MDNIMQSLSDWIKSTIENAVNELVRARLREENAKLLNRVQVADMLDVSPTTFDNHYRHMPGFPKELPGTKWKRAEIINWLNK